MPKIDIYKRDDGVDPAPRFASDAEIELAERLRHELEERYLGRPAAGSSGPSVGERH